jgi:hypothetical protein
METDMNQAQTIFENFRIQRGLVFGTIIIAALSAFEIFNYSTTDYALTDLLGDLRFMGVRWATILAIAFCGIDFAGIARLFNPNPETDKGLLSQNETWYLFGAWLLAATMNAMLTWWGVSLAILGHNTLGNDVVNRNTLLHVAPVFVAVLIWLIRVLIIGSFSTASNRIFGPVEQRQRSVGRTFPRTPVAQTSNSGLESHPSVSHAVNTSSAQHPLAPKPPIPNHLEARFKNRTEPSFRSLSMNASTKSNRTNISEASSYHSRAGTRLEQ